MFAFRETVTYWSPEQSIDRFGKKVFSAAPVYVLANIQIQEVRVLSEHESPELSESIIYTNLRLADNSGYTTPFIKGGYIYPGHSEVANPLEVTESRQIARVFHTVNNNATIRVYKYWLEAPSVRARA